jgi:hypothetical protein
MEECCDESTQDLKDWLEVGFKYCPWCGRKLKVEGGSENGE